LTATPRNALNVRYGSIGSVWRPTHEFRYTPDERTDFATRRHVSKVPPNDVERDACNIALGPRLQLISVENMEHPFKSWMIGLDYITRGTGSRRKN